MHPYHAKKVSTGMNDPVPVTGQKLLVSGLVKLGEETGPVALQRGMPVRSEEGVEIGVVAAVLDLPGQETTCFLLGYVPPTAVYRLVPLTLIDRIDGETIWLRVTNEALATLPIHQPDD